MSEIGIHVYTHEFSPKRGGIASYCHEFARAAAELGYTVRLYSPKNARHGDYNPNYKLLPGRAAGNHSLAAILQTRNLLKETLQKYPNDLHVLAEPGPIIAYGSLNQKLTTTARCHIILHGSEIKKWQEFGLKTLAAQRALRQADAICTVSAPIRKLAENAFPQLSHKLRAVPNALPANYQSILPPARAPSTTLNILSVGRIHPRKGFDQIIHALAKLPAATRRQIHYTIAGGSKDTNYLNRLKSHAADLSIQLEVKLDLSDAQLDACYRAADLFALTSISYKNSVEGFGIVYLEAGAYALACVAYDSGGVSDAVRHDQTGLLIPTGDIEQLAQAILRLFEDPELRIQLGQQNREFALQRTWQDVVSETIAPLA